jgi:hypothetical protein
MTYTFSTEDRAEADMLHHAAEAWAMLYEIRNTLRSNIKHDQWFDVEALYNEVCETLSRIET